MKNYFFKTIVTVFIFLASLTLTSCNFGEEGDEDEDIDPNKTQVYIGNYYGGLGDKWLKELKAQFEELYPDVQIRIDNDKNKFLRDNILNNISSSRDALFFVDRIYYYDMVKLGLLADITDAVTTPLTEYGEDVSIVDKMDATNRQYYGENEITGNKYYAIPTYLSHYGIVYDVDLFEEKKLYIGRDSTPGNIIWVSGKEEGSKSLGLDGLPGTYDDGLPETWTQFQELMEVMVQKGVTPFIWSGQYKEYSLGFLNGLWADYEGAENFIMNYTFSGSTLLDGDTQPTEITGDNAYELQRQSGKRFALEVAKHIMSDSVNYTSSSTRLTTDHLSAQDEFIASRPENNGSTIKPIAMIMEGDWWENEARDNGSFDSIVAMYGNDYAYGKRRFSLMPFPKTEGSAPGTTIFSVSGTAAFFINANCSEEILEIAKAFLRFCHTESALQIFTVNTGVIKPYTYTLTDEQYASLTHFSKTLYQIYKSENTKIVYDLSLSMKRINNSTYFGNYWTWYSNVSGSTYENPFSAFANNTSLTAKAYFDGLYTYHRNNWKTLTK